MHDLLYQTLYRIRRVEEAIARIYPSDKLKSPVHLSIGQEEVAAAMAVGVQRRLGANIGLSVTGIAGPTGGTATKPVGLVYLGLATPDRVQTRRLDLGSEQPREFIQRRAAKQALNWVRIFLGHRPSATPSSPDSAIHETA